MTANEVRQRALADLDQYRYEVPENAIGRPIPYARMASQLAKLRALLLPEPVRVTVAHRDTINDLDAESPDMAEVWTVARVDDETLVFFDESRSQYGLALGTHATGYTTMGVYGDLVGTFVAR